MAGNEEMEMEKIFDYSAIQDEGSLHVCILWMKSTSKSQLASTKPRN
jgi:hypothetical protein